MAHATGRHRAEPHVDASYRRAVEIARGVSGSAGFIASSEREHYFSVWARDAAFTLFGAIHSGDAELVRASRRSLLTLMRRQYADGQITDVYWPNGVPETNNAPYWDCGEAGATDATALFVIAVGAYLRHHPDPALRERAVPHVERAVQWLASRDDNKTGLIDQPEAADWMDAALVRSGKVFYTNVLFYRALRVAADLSEDRAGQRRYTAVAARLQTKINFAFWPVRNGNWIDMVGSLWGEAGQPQWKRFPHPATPAAYRAAYRSDRCSYLSHITWGEFVDKCDVLGNVLAVLFDIPDMRRARTIMRHLHAEAQRMPFPIATYLAPIDASDPSGMYKQHVDLYQGELWRNPPGSYHNAGIWPFIGGYYVLALEHVGLHREALHELRRLAAANAQLKKPDGKAVSHGFNEWLELHSGEARGADSQAWSAGAFIAATRSVRDGADVSF